MPSPPKIRAFRAEDLKVVRYFIGASLMMPLAAANNRAYIHPLTVAVWLGISSVAIQLLHSWPTTTGIGGYFGLFNPLPALAAVAVPIMFAFDWLQRPAFEEDLKKALTAQDMKEPQTHYSLSPASGFYILENNDKPIGLIAVDASTVSPEGPPSKTRSSKKEMITADTAVIRHFYVDEIYRGSGVQVDLLEYAISRAFSQASSPRPRKLRAVASMLDAYKMVAFRVAGFHPTSGVGSDERKEWKVGVFGWKYQWLEISREEWQAKREGK